MQSLFFLIHGWNMGITGKPVILPNYTMSGFIILFLTFWLGMEMNLVWRENYDSESDWFFQKNTTAKWLHFSYINLFWFCLQIICWTKFKSQAATVGFGHQIKTLVYETSSMATTFLYLFGLESESNVTCNC